MKRKWFLLAAVGFLFTMAGAQPARADHRYERRECERKIEKQEHKLEREIRRHGFRSRQAQREREKLFHLRRECGFGYGWGRHDDRRDRDWRDDDRYDNHWRNGRWDHDPDRCNNYRHRHDRDGRFRWNGTLWLRFR